jgi:hypothetical protein
MVHDKTGSGRCYVIVRRPEREDDPLADGSVNCCPLHTLEGRQLYNDKLFLGTFYHVLRNAPFELAMLGISSGSHCWHSEFQGLSPGFVHRFQAKYPWNSNASTT